MYSRQFPTNDLGILSNTRLVTVASKLASFSKQQKGFARGNIRPTDSEEICKG